jgi:hypothetical protein
MNLRSKYCTAVLLASLAVPLSAQLVCTPTSTPQLIRSEGTAELVGDILIDCTGGTPTVAGNVVPQMNLIVYLNTNITSKVVQEGNAAVAINFNEALLLVDEPNQSNPPAALLLPSRPLLNCGNVGAPDNGPSGPGVCSIVSTGNPLQTYDGTPYAGSSSCMLVTGAPTNQYGCGRPNVFQGRVGSTTGNQANVLVFNGVPLDPPGPNKGLVLRIKNVRANAAMLGGGSHPISALVEIQGATAVTVNPQQVTVGQSESGLSASIQPGKTVRITEGFSSAWKDRNVAFTLANAAYTAGHYVYNGGSSYPADAAQNVPSVVYNDEEGFQWQNNAANAPPSPNPPLGYSSYSGYSLNWPLNSVGYGLEPTGISAAGVASAGTRIAITFEAPGELVEVPTEVHLHPVGSPSVNSGLMILTKTDANGAGPFSATNSNIIKGSGTFVYEIVYSDPAEIEYADVTCGVSGMGVALVYANFAPFYTTPAANFPTPTPANPTPVAVPRFNIVGMMMLML